MAIAVAVFYFGLPVLASTRLVSQRISGELAAIAGMRVTSDGAPIIRIWPVFTATLNNAALRQWTDVGDEPVLTAQAVTLRLDPLSALSGKVRITKIDLKNPELMFDTSGPFAPEGGRLGKAIGLVRERLAAAGGEGTKAPELEAKAGIMLSFTGGQIRDGREAGTGITAIDGRLSWPALEGGAKLTAQGVWRGQKLNIDARAESLLHLLAGGESALEIEAKSEIGTFSFDGKARLAGAVAINGQVASEFASLRQGLSWLGFSSGIASDSFRLATRLSGAEGRWKLADVDMRIGESRASGVLEALTTKGAREVSGTLAFDTLPLDPFLPSIEKLLFGATNKDGPQSGKLDLRLSAERAQIAGLELTGIAASANLSDGRASFLVSDAALLGGMLEAGIRNEAGICTVFAKAKGLSTGQLSDHFGKASLGDASLDATLSLAGPFERWTNFLGGAKGEFNASMSEGLILGTDLGAFKDQIGAGVFFSLADVAPALQATSGGVLKATLEDGLARIDMLEAGIGGERIVLRGVTGLSDQSLALTGAVDPGGGKAALPFFIGGSWRTPFVSPAVRATQK